MVTQHHFGWCRMSIYDELSKGYGGLPYTSARAALARGYYSDMKAAGIFTEAEAQKAFFRVLGYKVRIK